MSQMRPTLSMAPSNLRRSSSTIQLHCNRRHIDGLHNIGQGQRSKHLLPHCAAQPQPVHVQETSSGQQALYHSRSNAFDERMGHMDCSLKGWNEVARQGYMFMSHLTHCSLQSSRILWWLASLRHAPCSFTMLKLCHASKPGSLIPAVDT